MANSPGARAEYGLRADITDALVAVWIRYSGKRPVAARTEVRDNVITCVLVDAVGDHDAGLIAAETQDAGRLRSAAYKSDAAAMVANLTGRRVTSFLSSYDPDMDVATETFTLERRFFS
jgi:Na+-translocating membrane potential-generating system (MpsC)